MPETDDFRRSYLRLRRFMGVVGIALPVVLVAGGLILAPSELRGSLSSYFWRPFLGSWFVGSMCSFGVFLLFYDRHNTPRAKGLRPRANLIGNVAGIAAIGVGLFPTTPQDVPRELVSVATVHMVCAVVFFAALSYFALFVFPERPPRLGATAILADDEQRARLADDPRPRGGPDRLFITCGSVMVVALVVALVAGPVLGTELYGRFRVLLGCEIAAIWAFGLSWLVKGLDLDRSTPGNPVADVTRAPD